MTAAIDSTRPASVPESHDPAPITSRTLSGRAMLLERVLGHPSPGGVLVDGPGLDRWRSTSLTKNGLPSVSRYTAWARPTPASSRV